MKRTSNKLLELEIFLNNICFHIFCVSERLSNNDTAKSINFDSYTLISCYCRSRFKNERTAIYFCNNLKYSEIDFLKKLSEDKHFEVVGMKLNIILSLYRSPDVDIKSWIKQLRY